MDDPGHAATAVLPRCPECGLEAGHRRPPRTPASRRSASRASALYLLGLLTALGVAGWMGRTSTKGVMAATTIGRLAPQGYTYERIRALADEPAPGDALVRDILEAPVYRGDWEPVELLFSWLTDTAGTRLVMWNWGWPFAWHSAWTEEMYEDVRDGDAPAPGPAERIEQASSATRLLHRTATPTGARTQQVELAALAFYILALIVLWRLASLVTPASGRGARRTRWSLRAAAALLVGAGFAWPDAPPGGNVTPIPRRNTAPGTDGWALRAPLSRPDLLAMRGAPDADARLARALIENAGPAAPAWLAPSTLPAAPPPVPGAPGVEASPPTDARLITFFNWPVHEVFDDRAFGWPLRCASVQTRARHTDPFVSGAIDALVAGGVVPYPALGARVEWTGPEAQLDLPVAAGALTRTTLRLDVDDLAMVALVVLLLWRAPVWLRRAWIALRSRRRTRRGLCVGCGYPLVLPAPPAAASPD